MKIMLLSDIPPCKNYTAGIVLNLMCDFLLNAGHEICCFTVKDKYLDARIPEDKLKHMQFENIEKPRENWGCTMFKAAGSFIGNNFSALFSLPQIARRAGNFAKENHAELVWCVVQGQTMIKLAEPTARHAHLPYIIQVWDPPEWWMMENKFDSYTKRSVMTTFGRALRHSKCCLTASWAMAENYGSKYQCKTIPVILGFSPDRIIPASSKRSDEFVIALSGQIYASQEFNALLQALDLMEWHYQEKTIKLRLYGRYFHLFFSAPSHIELRGWIEQEALLPELATADLLYCPYWFDSAFQLPSMLSFPSKLSTYLKTAVPVLVHGPEYASPRKYLVEHDAGYICNTLDPEGIKNILIHVIKQPDQLRLSVGEQGYQAFRQTLTTEHMQRAFFQALDLDICEGDEK